MWPTATFLLQAAVRASREGELLHSPAHPEPRSTVLTGLAQPPGSDASHQRCPVSLVQPSAGREGACAAQEVPEDAGRMLGVGRSSPLSPACKTLAKLVTTLRVPLEPVGHVDAAGGMRSSGRK